MGGSCGLKTQNEAGHNLLMKYFVRAGTTRYLGTLQRRRKNFNKKNSLYGGEKSHGFET